jgi:hypothetical protein
MTRKFMTRILVALFALSLISGIAVLPYPRGFLFLAGRLTIALGLAIGIAITEGRKRGAVVPPQRDPLQH